MHSSITFADIVISPICLSHVIFPKLSKSGTVLVELHFINLRILSDSPIIPWAALSALHWIELIPSYFVGYWTIASIGLVHFISQKSDL